MAILNGLIQKMKGSAGQLTFKSLNGQTVVSEGFRGFQRVSEGFRRVQTLTLVSEGFRRFQTLTLVSGFKFQVSRRGDEQRTKKSEEWVRNSPLWFV